MSQSISLSNPLLVNTLGHTSGVLLFGLLIVLLVKGWDKSRRPQRAASLIASCLAFLWNLGSLIGLGSTPPNGEVADWLVATNFSVLSLLPAILFAVVLRGRRPWLARIGYAFGLSSVALHFVEIRSYSAVLHEAALLLITIGFGALIVTAVVLGRWKHEHASPITDLICLFLFTVSFLHFGYGHSNTAWANEVTWHHAGIPLILVVLLRDYRFLFLETFIRFIANIGLAALYALGLYWLDKNGHLLERASGNGFAMGMLLISFCFSLVVFAYARSFLQKELTRKVFRRGDVDLCAKRIVQIAFESQSEKELLEKAADELCRFEDAERFLIIEAAAPMTAGVAWAEVELPLRFSRGDSLRLLLGARHGSRRYLAEDVAALTHLASVLAEQVERFRTNELERLAREAELRALQAQIHPHFLFNALNTLYGTIGRESYQARRLVLNLAELFRYCLHRDRKFIPLGEELTIVEAYLEIESLRLGDRLRTEVSASGSAREVMIPALTIQPLVENAVRHGVARRSTKGHVRVLAAEDGYALRVMVRDDGPGFAAETTQPGFGMGLENVRQRLRLCYGAAADLKIESTCEGTAVSFSIPLQSGRVGRSPAIEGHQTADVVHSTASTA